eukprot:31524-Pelagococcus_subviridis.AAC.8
MQNIGTKKEEKKYRSKGQQQLKDQLERATRQGPHIHRQRLHPTTKLYSSSCPGIARRDQS